MAGRVAVGFFSFTEVPAGRHHDYNAWHQLDHLPAQHVLPGIVHGERWACPPAAPAAVAVRHPLLGRAQYVTLYLLTEPVDTTLAAFRALAAELRDAGRFFADRESHRFGAWRVSGQEAAPRVLVDPAVVPWRPAAGVVVVVDDAAAPRRDLTALVAVDGVAGAWSFDRDPALHHGSWATADERITVAWVDGDPVHAVTAIAALVPGATHVAAYETIRPGDWDRYEAAPGA